MPQLPNPDDPGQQVSFGTANFEYILVGTDMKKIDFL